MTPWLLDAPLLMAGLLTLVSISILWIRFRSSSMSVAGLAGVGGLYGLFVLYLAWHFLA